MTDIIKLIYQGTLDRLWFFAALASLVLCSCNGVEEDGRIYTEDELGLEVEWIRGGWCEVKNELDYDVALTTTYRSNTPYSKTIVSGISVGGMAKLDAGASVPGSAIYECETATIRINNGAAILCARGDQNPWSKRFFENFERRDEYEIAEIHGKKVRHDLVVRTYHIDNSLVTLWLAGQHDETSGLYLDGECLVPIGSSFMGGGVADPGRGSFHRCSLYEKTFISGPDMNKVKSVVSFGGFRYMAVEYKAPGQYLESIVINLPDDVTEHGASLEIPLKQGTYDGGCDEVSSVKILDYSEGTINDITKTWDADGKIDIVITLKDGRSLRIFYQGRIPYDGYV